MAKKTATKKAAKSRFKNYDSDGMPAYQPREGQNDFLHVWHLGVGKKKGTIGAKGQVVFTGEKPGPIRSKFGLQYVFPVVLKSTGEALSWGITIGSGNHRRITERFGTKAPKGSVDVEVKENQDKLYVAIAD